MLSFYIDKKTKQNVVEDGVLHNTQRLVSPPLKSDFPHDFSHDKHQVSLLLLEI